MTSIAFYIDGQRSKLLQILSAQYPLNPVIDRRYTGCTSITNFSTVIKDILNFYVDPF